MINQVKILTMCIRFNRINKSTSTELEIQNKKQLVHCFFSCLFVCTLFVNHLSSVYFCVCVCMSLSFSHTLFCKIKIFTNGQFFLLTDHNSSCLNSMDESSIIIQTIIDNELDDLILDLVYELHSSLKGIPDSQLEINNNGTKNKTFLVPFAQTQSTAIEKQTCLCPHCGQSNIIAIRFAYHLAKCLGERKNDKECFHIRFLLSF